MRKIFNAGDSDSGPGLKEWFAMLALVRHDHLMPALGAFTHGSHFFILFEEASETLGSYLQSDGTSLRPEELWKQVQGLAEGLSHLHGTNHDGQIAYHRDLKPENILIVRKVMKIADFGLLELKSPGPLGDSGSMGHGNFDTRVYAAPQRADGKYTRSMDVWSLGAIISEIATFDLQKKEGVQEYRSDRKQDVEEGRNLFSAIFHNNGHMKQSVRDRHIKLRDKVNRSMQRQNREEIDPFQQHFFRDAFFKMVQEMLWDGDQGCPSANEVAHRLSKLRELAQFDEPIVTKNIWQALANRTLANSPTNANCRLQVKPFLGSEN